MKVIFESSSNLSYDQEGEPYFYHDNKTLYLNKFSRITNSEELFGLYFEVLDIVDNNNIIMMFIMTDNLEENVYYSVLDTHN
jgi:hypothetical protein